MEEGEELVEEAEEWARRGVCADAMLSLDGWMWEFGAASEKEEGQYLSSYYAIEGTTMGEVYMYRMEESCMG